MTDLKEIKSLPVEDELHTCPDYGYALGFHTSFISTSVSRDNPVKSTREVWRVILICPECGARFDAGWRISFAEPGSRLTKAPFRTAPCVPHGSPAACLPPPSPHDTHTPNNPLFAGGVRVVPSPSVNVRNTSAAGFCEL